MKQKRLQNNTTIHFLFAVYFYVLCKVILFKFGSINIPFLWRQLKVSLDNPDSIIRRLQKGNLIPFKEISRTLDVMSSHELINLVGNIAIFLPYGILLGLLSKNKRISCIGAFIRSLGLSLGLESAQALFSIGSFDVDDLLLNSCGGLMGFILLRLSAKIMLNAINGIQARDRPV